MLKKDLLIFLFHSSFTPASVPHSTTAAWLSISCTGLVIGPLSLDFSPSWPPQWWSEFVLYVELKRSFSAAVHIWKLSAP